MSWHYALVAGFVTGLSLILPIGVQNAFVIRHALDRQTAVPVITAAIFGDTILILLGVTGLGGLLAQSNSFVEWGGTIGGIYVGGYALRLLFESDESESAPEGRNASVPHAVIGTLALTFLNPHAILDTVILLGSASLNWGDHRWEFAVGAILASTVWFSGIGLVARRAHGIRPNRTLKRCFRYASGTALLLIAGELLGGG